MTAQKARKSDERRVRVFLEQHEPASCMLAERLFQPTAGQSNWYENLTLYLENNQVQSLLYANPHGLYLPLAWGPQIQLSSGIPAPFALVGLDRDVLPCLRQLPTPRVHWQYLSLTLPHPAAEFTAGAPLTGYQPTIWQSLKFRMAGLADLDTVLPLQCAYEVEEVLAPGMPLRTDASRLILRQQITRGLVTIVQAGAQIIAKAGLNATGSRYAQIGGVYTLPQWRNQGIASQLMKLLVQAMLACGWGGSLFVKTHNTPALRVYRKLGFQEQGSFSVVYF